MANVTGMTTTITSASRQLVTKSNAIAPTIISTAERNMIAPCPTKRCTVFNIRRGAGEQLAGLRLVVIAEGEGLDLGIELVAQVIGDALRRARRQRALSELEHGAQHAPGPPSPATSR